MWTCVHYEMSYRKHASQNLQFVIPLVSPEVAWCCLLGALGD